jgi:tetratricopeptide (TPR) repeat protein
MARKETSVQVLESRLSQNPQSLVFARVADGFRKNGEIQQAITMCIQGLANHPDYVTGRVILGRCYLEQEKLKEAVAEFAKAVELDRRNQVALKMIADIHARQGLKEKAGDLYSCLLAMDPDNQSLVKLSSTFRGSGDANVFRILGIQSSAPASSARPDDGASFGDDVVVDVDKTMQFDMGPSMPSVAVDEGPAFSDMLVKTQQFDVQELGAAATVLASGVKGAGVVTGDDVRSRMDMMFESGQTAAPAPKPEELDHVEIGHEDSPPADEEIGVGTILTSDTSVVSGSDISSRIEQLFGGEEAPPAAKITEMPEVNDETESPLAVETLSAEKPLDELRPFASSAVSGEDITSRLNEMFDEVPAMEPLSFEEKQEPVEAPSAADTHVGPEPQLETPRASAEVTDLTEENVLASNERIETDSGAITGDDVALRLNTIFDEQESSETAQASAVLSDLATTESFSAKEETPLTDDAPRPEEGTKGPFDISDNGIVIGSEEADSEEIASQTMAVPLSVLQVASGDSPESDIPAIDDPIASGSDDDAPGMSGDDVVDRMEELFRGSLINDNDLRSVESIPEGNADDSAMSHGFYTMSGENAEKSEAGDVLLSELDAPSINDPDSATIDFASEPEEKTVLMDEDGGETVAPDQEETIVPSSIDPFLASSTSAPIVADNSEDASGTFVQPMPLSDDTEESETGENGPLPQEYSIPDHVLTPTLADIYYQQGQPQLALQIYRRLFETDPDNERMAERIREIEASVAMQETDETVLAGDSAVHTVPKIAAKPESTVDKKKTPPARPLAGVRIKKKFKNKLRKK